MNDAWLRTFSPHDLLLVGILIGMWISGRGRRHQGERLGRLEELWATWHGRDLTGRRDTATLDPPPK